MLKIFQVFFILFFSLWIAQPAFAQSGTVLATVRPNPLEVVITAPAAVTVGQNFTISAQISNLGSLRINRAVATLNIPPEISVKGNKSKGLGNLTGGETTTVSWQANVTLAGNFVVQVEVSGFLEGELISASDSTLISASNLALAGFFRRLIFGS